MRGSHVSLTLARVNQAEPRSKIYEIWDSKCPGFGVRISPAGTKTYFAKYRTNEGEQRRVSIGRHGQLTTNDARDLAREIITEARGGTDVAELRKAARRMGTVVQLVETWDREIGPSKRPTTLRRYAQLHAEIVGHLGGVKLDRVTPGMVSKMHREITASGRATTANRAVERLRALYTAATDKLDLLPREHHNPAARFDRNREEPRDRVVTPAEWRRIEAACKRAPTLPERARGHVSEAKAGACRFLLLRGLRRSEACLLSWEHVDLEAGIMRIPGTKTGTIRVGIDAATGALLRERLAARDPACPWVFPTETGTAIEPDSLSKAFRRICKLAEVEGVGLHDLRRTWISMAVAAGQPLAAAGKAVGHRSPQATARYYQSDGASTAAAVAKFREQLETGDR